MDPKQFTRFAVLLLIVFLGLYLGWRWGSGSKSPEIALKIPNFEKSPEKSGKAEIPRTTPMADWGDRPIRYPDGAVQGEILFTFNDESSYRKYLWAMEQAGLQPLGQIDTLRILRLKTSVLSQLKIPFESIDFGFNYRVSQPAPPIEALPEGLFAPASYNQTAAQITKSLEGDGSGVLVAVLDSGLFPHTDFEDVAVEELVLTGGQADDPGAEHGTSVASIISGSNGVAPASSLFIVRVLGEEGEGHSFHVAEGIIHAVERGAKILNMSLGLYEDSALLRHAVQYAHNQGVLMVAAAGNDRYTQLSYPAAYAEVLSVTAVDARHQQAGFPNQSAEINFAAPGVGIVAATEEGKSGQFTGTSAAAPFVSGTLAALLSKGDLLSPDQAVAQLEQSLNEAGALGDDPLYGGGWIDWERLSETEAERPDIALADIYFPPEASPGTNVSVDIVIQNRGNRWLSGGELVVQLSDSPDRQTFALRSTQPGEAFSQKIYVQVPPAQLLEKIRVTAVVQTDDAVADVVPDNNFKIVEFGATP